jgi:predicted transcriptional regulator
MIIRGACGILANPTIAKENRVTLVAPDTELGQHVSDIVAAYVGNHQITVLEVPALIQSVYGALTRLTAGTVEPQALPQEPAVPIKKSVFPGYIICLEDGEKLKMLKRHLRISYNMTPQEYRAKWGLSNSYPMTAPDYAERRSTLAKAHGLGHKKEPATEAVLEPVIQKIPEKRRGTRRPRSTEEA